MNLLLILKFILQSDSSLKESKINQSVIYKGD